MCRAIWIVRPGGSRTLLKVLNLTASPNLLLRKGKKLPPKITLHFFFSAHRRGLIFDRHPELKFCFFIPLGRIYNPDNRNIPLPSMSDTRQLRWSENKQRFVVVLHIVNRSGSAQGCISEVWIVWLWSRDGGEEVWAVSCPLCLCSVCSWTCS